MTNFNTHKNWTSISSIFFPGFARCQQDENMMDNEACTCHYQDQQRDDRHTLLIINYGTLLFIYYGNLLFVTTRIFFIV